MRNKWIIFEDIEEICGQYLDLWIQTTKLGMFGLNFCRTI